MTNHILLLAIIFATLSILLITRLKTKLLISIALFVAVVAAIESRSIREALISHLTRYLPERVELVEVTPAQKSLRDLVTEIPAKYGLSPVLVAAIIDQESGGYNTQRYEPGQMDRAKKAAPRGAPDHVVKLYSSSHCYMQVMGWHAPTYNLDPMELYQPSNCIEVGSAILKGCLDRQRAGQKYDRIKGALACYNGSTQYADAVMSRLGRLLIEHTL